ncbi:MAG: hypothetical protein EZS28_001986 [Streblomastix strix]|uniref:Uncharacterized protein n=1 Tax=Streblomastix strix TaxID=222440 RepID=A0A5J4X7H4_9EUKA|nr:MAG: hypothetical protein EZS28_001986 [Streblomastix strix]
MNQPNDEYIVRNCSFTNCVNSAGAGGAFNIDISNGAVVAFFSSLFVGCRSQLGGGGIFASISSGGQIILDNLCEFYQCKTYGNGGGIYIFIDFTIQSSFIIKDAIFQGCQAMNNYFIQYSYSQTGFGGGVFLGVYGDYDPSINHIDLHGMNISNNSADKYGQSLFVVMRDIIEWCQYGTQGEYVKGNYSDTYSNETDLVGIPMDLSTFNSSSLQTIEQQQQPLELWWRILGILKSAKVIVNESNPIGKLIFHLEGQEMTPGYLNIKIFELRDKTQEEIEQQQKEMNYNFNKNNFKSQKDHSLQSQIAPEHKNVNQQQISISSNLKFNQTLHNSENEIIYPPEDGSNIPIKVVTEIRGSLKAQKATFGLNDYEWLNYKQKVYGVLISNDRNIFTGKQGAENASIILDVVEENDKNALSIWIIIIIIIGSIVIFGIGLFSIIFVVYINV